MTFSKNPIPTLGSTAPGSGALGSPPATLGTTPAGSPANPQPQKTGCGGCLLTGCITVVVVLVLLLCAGGYGLYRLKSLVLDGYTQTSPMPIQSPQPSDAEVEKLRERVGEFLNLPIESKDALALSLTAEDTMTLILSDPQIRKYQGLFGLEFIGDEARLKVSIPLNEFGMTGRYLNGVAQFGFVMSEDRVTIDPSSIEIAGRSLPQDFIDKLREGALSRGLENKARAESELGGRIGRIEIRDGKLLLYRRQTEPLSPPGEPGQVTAAVVASSVVTECWLDWSALSDRTSTVRPISVRPQVSQRYTVVGQSAILT